MNSSMKLAVSTAISTVLVTLGLTGCQSTDSGTNENENLRSQSKIAQKRDEMRKKWSCEVRQESDYQVTYQEHDFYATLTVPSIQPNTVKRLRTDFILPTGIEDIVSIKTVGEASSRLMKGYIPTKVCGDFFIRNRQLADNALSIFTDITDQTSNSPLVWQIIYIDASGDIYTTQKALGFSQ